jgi:ADP-heptose:LPS heptosyltransferase
MEAPPNILLIRLKSIGDIIFTLPAVQALRAAFPAAKITFLTSRENAPLLRGFAGVDEVLTVDRALFRAGQPRKVLSAGLDLLRRLRRARFTLVFDFQGYGETEWLAWWTGAPERWGIIYRSGGGWVHTGTSRRAPTRHPAEWDLDLLRRFGLRPGPLHNDYVLPADALAAAREFFTAHQLNFTRPALFIQPLTSSPQKNWPLARYVWLAERWRTRGGQVVFGGGPAERAVLEPVRAAGFIVAAGTPLLVSAGLMQLSAMVVGADTGLLHLAVAMGRRVVMIMDSNRPGSCHPCQHPEWTVTPPAGKTVADIEPGRVESALELAFAELPPARPAPAIT